MRSADERQVEIFKLSELKPRVPRFSNFPNCTQDSHHKAIEAQIWVLITNPSELSLEAEALGNEWADSVHDNALSALRWMNGESDQAPSDEWKSLTPKEDAPETLPNNP